MYVLGSFVSASNQCVMSVPAAAFIGSLSGSVDISIRFANLLYHAAKSQQEGTALDNFMHTRKTKTDVSVYLLCIR